MAIRGRAARRGPFAILAPAVLVVSTLVGTLGVAAPAVAAPDPAVPLSEWSTASLALPNGGVAFDPLRHRLLVGVSGRVPTLGNRLVELDPVTGAIGRSVALGSEPSVVAASDDGTRAYVGFSGAAVIAEVALDTFTVTRRFALGNDTTSGSYYAEDIEVQPGHPHVIAVSRRNVGLSPRHEGVAVYDDGVQRATTTPDHTGANRIAFSDKPGVLYGYNNETTGYGLYTMAVEATGVQRTATQQLFTGFSLEIEWAGGMLTASNGRVVDPVAGSIEGSFGRSGAFETDVTHDRTYFLGGGSLTAHRTSTMLQQGSLAVAMSTPRQLVDVGGGLAGADANGIVLIGPGVTGTSFALPPAPSSVVRAPAARTVPVRAAAVVADPDGDVVYAVTTTADSQPQEVVEIDPVTGARGRHVFVGGGADVLEVTDDGGTLVVGHADANRVTEVDTSSFTVRRRITLPSGSNGATFATDLDAVPGATDRYAVHLDYEGVSPAHAGVALVVDGVVQPKRTPTHTGPTDLAFGDDPTRLFGHNGSSTEYGFYTVGVADDGLTVLSSIRRLTTGFGLRLESAAGVIYASSGAVIDPKIPAVVGQFAVSGIPVPITSSGRVLFVDGRNVHETEADVRTTVATYSSLLPETAVDAVAAGTTLVVAQATKLSLVPLVGPPRAPASPTATAGDDRVTVGWGTPGDDGGSPITSYRVYRDGDLLATTDGDARSWVDEGAENGTTHHYAVAAVNASGEGARSAERAATAQGPLVGTVTEAGGAPVAGAWVLEVPLGDGRLRGAVTDAEGNYRSVLEPGARALAFLDPTGAHAGQWWDGHPSTALDEADPVEVTIDGARADAEMVAVPSTSAVGGRVIDETTSEPLQGVWVALVRASDQSFVGGEVTDSDGRYSFGQVAGGTHLLVAVDPTGAHRLRFFGDGGGSDDAVILTLTPGDDVTADLALVATGPSGEARSAVVRGTVTAVGGAGLPGAWVVAIDTHTGALRGGSVAGAAGAYELDVPPGDYWIEALDPLGGHRSGWHTDDDAVDQTTVSVGAEDDVTADVVLSENATGGSLAGRVTGGAGPAAGVFVFAVSTADFSLAAGAVTAADGGYRIEGLDDGRYVVFFMDPSGALSPEWSADASDPGQATPVEVTAGADITLDAVLGP